MSTVLLDMDGVVADWGAHYDYHLDLLGDVGRNIRRHAQQTSFNLTEGCTREEAELIDAVMDLPGFYADLRPITGAIDAMNEMLAEGHNARIVTSPWVTNPTCASDKIAWAMLHAGTDWGKRTIITYDKTLVRGDILIDDKPEVTGSMPPEWEHIVFDQPYNRHVTGRRRMTDWSQWRSFLEREPVHA